MARNIIAEKRPFGEVPFPIHRNDFGQAADFSRTPAGRRSPNCLITAEKQLPRPTPLSILVAEFARIRVFGVNPRSLAISATTYVPVLARVKILNGVVPRPGTPGRGAGCGAEAATAEVMGISRLPDFRDRP